MYSEAILWLWAKVAKLSQTLQNLEIHLPGVSYLTNLLGPTKFPDVFSSNSPAAFYTYPPFKKNTMDQFVLVNFGFGICMAISLLDNPGIWEHGDGRCVGILENRWHIYHDAMFRFSEIENLKPGRHCIQETPSGPC